MASISGGYQWFIGRSNEYFDVPGTKANNNAYLIYSYIKINLKWEDYPICAMLGNIEAESTFNPRLHEQGNSKAGRGFMQWTPRTDLFRYLDILYGERDWDNSDWYSPNKQCSVISAEYHNDTGQIKYGIDKQWLPRTVDGITYNWTYDQFAMSKSTDIDMLTRRFCWQYLRPAYETAHMARRIASAKLYYEICTGNPPAPTPGDPGGGDETEVPDWPDIPKPPGTGNKLKWLYYMRNVNNYR